MTPMPLPLFQPGAMSGSTGPSVGRAQSFSTSKIGEEGRKNARVSALGDRSKSTSSIGRIGQADAHTTTQRPTKAVRSIFQSQSVSNRHDFESADDKRAGYIRELIQRKKRRAAAKRRKWF